MSHGKQPTKGQAFAARYAHDGFAVLRTPLLPLDTLAMMSALAEASGVDDASDRLDEVAAADWARLGPYVQRCFASSAMREALFVASPDLHDALCKTEAVGDGGLVEERVLLALARYLARAAGRATPFGLFAGCSTVPIGERTRLELGGRDTYRRYTRFDMDYLAELTRTLATRPEVRRAVRLTPNSSIHVAGDVLHYVTAQHLDRSRRYSLEVVDVSEAVTGTLARAASGATFDNLARALVEDDVTLDDASAFIDELIDAQLLVPEIDSPVTGGDAGGVLLSDLEEVPGSGTIAHALRVASEQLRHIDAQGAGVAPAAYVACAEALKTMPVPLNLARLFQVDLYKPPLPQASLGEVVAAEAARAADILCRIASGSDPLEQFRDRFRERYAEQEVSLLEALDDELGIGLDPAANDGHLTIEAAAAARHREAWLAELCARSVRSGEAAVELSPEDMKRLERLPQTTNLPDSLSVVGTVLARSSEDVDEGAFHLLVTHCSGPSGAGLLGRFSHLDSDLCRRVQSHLRTEERVRPDALLAEVIHLPQGRTGNVLSRPLLRPYEIPYLGRSVVPRDQQLSPSDLTLSLAGDRIVLRSRRLGREVLPRLTSAHNYGDRRELPVYRFLCLLQRHGLPQHAGWDWGEHARVAAFLPRVGAGRLILSRARWLLSSEELRALGAAAQGAERLRAARAWRSRRRLPRWVLLADGDNQLPIDFESVLSLDVFVELTRKRHSAVLLEALPSVEESPVSGPEGRFAHEVVIPLTKATTSGVPRPAPRRNATQALGRAPTRGRRHFVPGSPWLYVKLYSGPATSDRLLQTLVGPFAREAVRSGLADQWFFIRYHDTASHLRVRFSGQPEALQGGLLPKLSALVAPLVEDGIIARVQQDTYVREIERYGGDEGIKLAEQWFCSDSECALDLIVGPASTGEGAEDAATERLCSAIAIVDGVFEAFEWPLQRRRRILEEAASGRANGSRKVWGEWYRKHRTSVEAALSRSSTADHLPWRRPAIDLAVERTRPVARELLRLERDGGLTCTLDGVLTSFVHLSINRTLTPEQARSEAMCYDALSRYYQSVLARLGSHGAILSPALHSGGSDLDGPAVVGVQALAKGDG